MIKKQRKLQEFEIIHPLVGLMEKRRKEILKSMKKVRSDDQ